MAILTGDAVRARLLRECGRYGEAAVATRLGVSASLLINIRQGRAAIGPKVLDGMGLEVVYRTKAHLGGRAR